MVADYKRPDLTRFSNLDLDSIADIDKTLIVDGDKFIYIYKMFNKSSRFEIISFELKDINIDNIIMYFYLDLMDKVN